MASAFGKLKNRLPNTMSSRKPIGASRPMVQLNALRRNEPRGLLLKNHVNNVAIGTRYSSRLIV